MMKRIYVYLQGNHFQQNNILTSNNDHEVNKNVVNIFIVYKLDPLASNQRYYFYYTKCFIWSYANY